MALTGEDISKINSIVEEPLEKCLLYLAFKADKVLLEDILHKESLNKFS